MRVGFYRNYNFIDKDPIIDALRTVVQDENLSDYAAEQISGVSATTFKNWFRGPTRRPNNATATQVAAAFGYVRRDRMDARGNVVVAYEKVRTIDQQKEREKQANWLLKHGRKKKKRKIAAKTKRSRHLSREGAEAF